MHRILKLSFSTQVFLALCLGIFIGLFFGEKVAWLNMVGMAFIKLIQIAIIPYIVLSLVTGLGSLSYEQPREIAKKFIITLLSLWAIGLLTSACTNKPFFEKYHAIFMEYFLNFNSAPQKNHQFLRIA